jgi:hypothetical protein
MKQSAIDKAVEALEQRKAEYARVIDVAISELLSQKSAPKAPRAPRGTRKNAKGKKEETL